MRTLYSHFTSRTGKHMYTWALKVPINQIQFFAQCSTHAYAYNVPRGDAKF